MIKRKEEINIRPVKGAQGGKGQVYFHDWLTKEEACNLGRVFSKLVIPPEVPSVCISRTESLRLSMFWKARLQLRTGMRRLF